MGQVVGTYIINQDGTPIDQDQTSTALVTIDHTHHMIHAGRHFYISDYTDLTNGQVLDYIFITPAASTEKYVHFILDVEFELEGTVQVYEGVSVTTNGTEVPSYCSNRFLSNTALSKAYHTPTGVVLGTLIGRIIKGSGKGAGGQARSEHELVMKPGTIYFFRVTNNTTSNNWFNYQVNWYENVDGE